LSDHLGYDEWNLPAGKDPKRRLPSLVGVDPKVLSPGIDIFIVLAELEHASLI